MPVNIVVVDDDPGFRRVAKALLTARGFSVIAETADGASGIAAVRQHRPDGVLLDMYLPDQEGIQVARALKVHGDSSRVVITSTEDLPWSEEELAEAGVVRFITKDRLFDADLAALFEANS
ncbi:response regulator transcription factor [Streptomyces sp. NPDC005708]|uniref:response regulator n=1 Tax=Streptomyces sp. NPDC005708 TaxID=3154564 RepID=UPI0033F94523